MCDQYGIVWLVNMVVKRLDNERGPMHRYRGGRFGHGHSHGVAPKIVTATLRKWYGRQSGMAPLSGD